MSGKNDSKQNGNPSDMTSHETFDASPDDIEIVGDDSASHNSEDSSHSTAEGEAVKSLNQQLEKAKGEYLYLRADFDNYRKQAIKERSDLIRFGAERFIVDLLNVVDNFDRAMETEVTAENVDSFKQGMAMISAELYDVLQRHGVEAKPGEGQPFDPNIHEALSSEPTTDFPPGHITREIRKAYQLHDKLIRPAQVVVASEPSESSGGGNDA